VDESAGIKVHLALKGKGYDSKSAIEELRGAKDLEIIEVAKKENRILITCDKDFGRLALLYKPPGAIILRLSDERAKNKVKYLLLTIERYKERLYGSLIIITEYKVRFRKIS